MTRYTAIFLSQAPEFVGSVRSCRLIMLELSLMYDTLWTCSGYSTGVGELVRAAPNYYLLIDGTFRGEPYLRRVNDEDVAVTGSSPHNLFAVPEEVWLWADEREYNIRPNVTGIAYRTIPPDGGVVATRVTVDYRGAGFRPRWDYDPSTRTYLRFDEGQPYDDKLTGEQLRFDNVLIIAAS